MKKKHLLLILVVLLTFSITTAAFAKKGGKTVEGYFVEVTTNVDGFCETLVIETDDGELVTFTLEDGNDCSKFAGFEAGITYVKVSGEWNLNAEGEVVLDLSEFEPAEPGEKGEDDDSGSGGVYCNGGKDEMHPVTKKISDKYEGVVDSEWVKDMVCDGFGFGEVMLAIQTQLAYQKKNGEGEVVPGEGCVSEEPPGDGEEGTAEEPEGGEETVCNSLGDGAEQWLNHRKAGQGWGQIWKGIDIVENDNTDSPGNGRFNKPEKEKGPKEGKGPDKGPEHPSNKLKPNKENKNNKNKNDEDD
jgi:hypothetical protein